MMKTNNNLESKVKEEEMRVKKIILLILITIRTSKTMAMSPKE